jgi:hypothetical protein
MTLRRTHTYVIAKVSPDTYNEIKKIMIEAGYNHVIYDGGVGETIDMHGIALQKSEQPIEGEA